MEDFIGKICNRLTSNPHVIGIILNCSEVLGEDDLYNTASTDISSTYSEEVPQLDMCVISKETGNQKTVYTENGVTVCLRWRTEDQFIEVLNERSSIDSKKILYDKTGLISRSFNRFVVAC